MHRRVLHVKYQLIHTLDDLRDFACVYSRNPGSSAWFLAPVLRSVKAAEAVDREFADIDFWESTLESDSACLSGVRGGSGTV